MGNNRSVIVTSSVSPKPAGYVLVYIFKPAPGKRKPSKFKHEDQPVARATKKAQD